MLYSTPVELAAGGSATNVDVVIPADTALGSHTLVVWALVDGEVKISGLVVDVLTLLPPGGLPATGSSPLRTTSVGLLLLILGAAFTGFTRRRRTSVAE